MVSRFMDLERRTLLVQFIAVEPLTFYSTSDGTDLVQDILHKQLARSDADLFGQEGSLSLDDQGEFLTFEPTDTNNRTIHLPIEHLAYCGALRRMRRDASDQREADQIVRREFENVDLANRYAQHIIGPPIFAVVFHGFDNALCYTFVTQSAEDACLLVMKLMRAFKLHEQRQGQINQGSTSFPSFHNSGRSPSPVTYRHENLPVQSSQPFATDNRRISSPPFFSQQTSNTHNQNSGQDELIQQLLANPNLQLVNQSTPFTSQRFDDLPILSASSLSMNQQTSPHIDNYNAGSSGGIPFMGRSTPQPMRPPSPPIIGIPDAANTQHLPFDSTNPQVIYKPNNQEVVYKQNIMVRWLQPPTPPPPAPIIIREVQAPIEPQPPIVCRQMPRCPPTPPPIIVREKPPPCPPPGQPLIIEKRIPPVCAPRPVIVERYPAPPPKPPAIIYEKYIPPVRQPRQVIVKREVCRPAGCPVVHQQLPARHLVREVIRQIPQTATTCQPALVCVPQQQQQQSPQTLTQTQALQQLVPIFATRQHVVQPQGVRVIRQVIGPAQVNVQQPQQVYPSNSSPMFQAMPTTLMQ